MPRTTKRDANGEGTEGAVAHAIDRLYQAPLDDFVRSRRELAAELRKDGDKLGARRVAEIPKPSRAAWAINQVARSHPERVQAMLDARHDAEDVQREGGADRIRQALVAYRAKTQEVVHAARDVLASAGVAATAALLREMGDALRTASADEGFVRRRLVEGRLTREEEPEEDLVAVLGTSERRTAQSVRKHEPSSSAKVEERAAANARAAAKAREEARERANASARAKAHARAVEKATNEVDIRERAAAKARAATESAEARAAEARAALKRLKDGERG